MWADRREANCCWLTLKKEGGETPGYAKWPEFHDLLTLGWIRKLEKVIPVALRLVKPFRNDGHSFGGKPVESNRFQKGLTDLVQQKDVSQCCKFSQLSSHCPQTPQLHSKSGPEGAGHWVLFELEQWFTQCSRKTCHSLSIKCKLLKSDDKACSQPACYFRRHRSEFSSIVYQLCEIGQ